ncbi:DNA sulfur modification protein DndB [Motiliproteus sediminis]|uniref:DNA sulfur modification protein DndB n=1 Tax=Motiliproteus sediminis TaxID=1468178 RepID=UPI001AEFA8DA|nr:DNA sulfur modification protein DndB [Motiliproteus sediminis]
MDTSFEYIFPAIRGIQAGREYYVSMCPLKLIPRIFLFDEEELVPELRAQRILNNSRIPQLARYIVENEDNYVFSSITASIDGDVHFEALGDKGEASRVGSLKIDMNSQFIINDGQHRRAAIEEAIKANPKLGDETISVVFFVDRGLQRCQQMFADLNLNQVKTSRSIGILYDHRDDRAQVAKRVAIQSNAFNGLVEMERNSLSPRSRKLFTLSAIYQANTALLQDLEVDSQEAAGTLCIEFWDEVSKHIEEWQKVRELKITSGETRQDYIHSHAIALQSLGIVGNRLLKRKPKSWQRYLKDLSSIDWRRDNAKEWEGRTMIGGRISKASHNITLTVNLIKQKIGLDLSPEELRAEEAYQRGNNEN